MTGYDPKRGVTLLELLIAISLLSLVVLTLSSIDLFSRHNVLTADRGTKLQNELSYALEHMTKQISKAIGNRGIAQRDPINFNNITGDPAINFFIDLGPLNLDGSFQPGDGQGDPQAPTQMDRWSAYRFTTGNFQIWYYPDFVNNPGNYDVIAEHIIIPAIPGSLPTVTDNYVDIRITGRWQPAQAKSIDNPEITMRARIKMPSVSTR